MPEPKRPTAPAKRSNMPAKRSVTSAKREPTRTPAATPGRSDRTLRRRVAVFGMLLGLVLVGGLFAFVYPTRTYLDQRSDLRAAEERLALLQEENGRLASEAERLQSDEAVERIAREQYGLLRPGEHAFVIVPVPTTAPPSTTTAPTTTPPPSTAATGVAKGRP